MTVDDYLDLLNYAKALGDQEWQADIVAKLKNVKQVTAANERDESVIQLWGRFDQINLLLTELYHRVREQEESGEVSRWKEQIWELKLERISIARLLQERYIKLH